MMVVYLRVALLNDFEAVGYGIPALQPEDLVVINDVPVQDKVGSTSKYMLPSCTNRQACGKVGLDPSIPLIGRRGSAPWACR